MLRFKQFSLVILLSLIGCIDPLDVDVNNLETQLLVVEGSITTAPGPHTIQLTTTAGYGSLFDGVIGREEGASVSVRDGAGQVEFLTELGDGLYQTSSTFRAEVGQSYVLQIIRRNGSSYSSIPELVRKVAPIDSVIRTFKEVAQGVGLPKSGIDVSISFQDDPNEKNYYLSRYTGIYKINARPDLNLDEFGNLAPLDCCEECWTFESSPIPNLFQDNTLNGSNITLPVGFIEDDGVRFGDRYFMVIEHASLTPSAYQFNQLVLEQLSIAGDIFDPPPATVRGNMIGVTNPNELVIGFFRASDVQLDSLFILPNELLSPKEPTLIRGDCRNYKPNATVIPPDFWP